MPDLGIRNGQLMPCPKTPNCVSSQAVDAEHTITPLSYPGIPQEARARLLQILESEKRLNILTADENYIRVEFASAFFGFVDDAEFYFSEKDADVTVIQVRSAARVGHSDLGVNRKRMEQIRGEMNGPQE